MAALCPGVQYGLSSQQNFSENKDLIFVKLTDSALRAIEEFVKNQNKFSCQSPTIKFLQNTGELSFPSLHHEGGSTSFRFSMSSTADMEGPAGSFECIQQIGSPRTGCLECLGSIPYKIRILANDDVYEATRNRMTEAEDKYKNKCTREIKPNERDIGRKVKVKQSRTAIVPPLRREQPSSMRESLVKPSYQSPVPPVNKPIVNHHHQQQQQHSSATTAPATTTTTNGLSNGVGFNYVSSSSKPHHNNKPSLPDIARRPLRERLVHLLALRPFKKFEIHDRLIKEGLREKNAMTSILKQIADMKDNSYILKRSCWNDVKEDWPFYTESEKQTLKRRKPANLTPPGVNSDGGSSGSGQSPTSTHPGSPPQITSTNKRPGFYENGDGIPTKRQRVSHYKRPANDQPISTGYSGAGVGSGKSLIENGNSQRRPVTDSRDTSNMNPRSRESPITTTPTTTMPTAAAASLGNSNYFSNYFSNGPPVSNGGEKRVASTLSEDDDSSNEEEEQLSANSKKRAAACDSYGQPPPPPVAQQQQQKTFNHNRGPSPISRTAPVASTTTDCSSLGSTNNGYSNGTTTNRKSSTKDHRDKDRKYSKVTSSTNNNNNNNNRVARVSPDSQTDNLPLPSSDLDKTPVSTKSPSVKPDSLVEYPNYLTQYVTIENAEQRRRYKADFNADYQEYRELHSVVERVSRRFAQLEESLRKEDKNSTKYKELKKQIVKEYNQKKEDMEHQQQKKRFQYLHDKLSHIKRLVQDYDQSLVPPLDENTY